MSRTRSWLAAALLTLAAQGCDSATAPSGTARVVGQVQYMGFEGGFYTIRSSDGTYYDVHDLPAEFRVDHLDVASDVRIVPSGRCIHQFGTIAEVVSIRRR